MSVLDTERLILNPFTLADADNLFRIRGDQAAMAHWDWPPDNTIEQTRAVAHMFISDTAAGAAHYWTARTKKGSEFVGVFDLSELTDTDADLGFMICRDKWGLGFAHEGSTAVVNQARSLRLKKLKARIHADNQRSEALLLRLGFMEDTARVANIEVRPSVFAVCRFFELVL